MSRLPEPLAGAGQRIPEQGRIRMGVKSGKAMKSIATWRLTSQDRVAIEKAAELYGGTARPWADAPTAGEWEVITATASLPVVLPPNPLGGTPVYELWSKGGLQRRCDGVTCLVPVSTKDGWENAELPCKCVAGGAMSCDPHTRLSVILPELPFAGVWRLDTKGWNAFHELPGMVEALEHLLGAGRLTRAFLVNEGEEVTRPKPNKPGEVQTQVYRVPRLRWPATFDEVLAGASDVAALARVPSPAGELPPPPAGDGPTDDDDPAEAEIVWTEVDARQRVTLVADAAESDFDVVWRAFVARYPELEGEALWERIGRTAERISDGELRFEDVRDGVAVVVVVKEGS